MATTMKYTHLRPAAQKAPLERLAKTLQLEDLVTAPRLRSIRKKAAAG